MSVKFKIGFTMDAETLFNMISKFLPVHDLHVEEVIERPAPPASPPAELPTFVSKLTGKTYYKNIKPKHKRASRPVNLHDGINGIIIRLLLDGRGHHLKELAPLVTAAGYSENSIASRIVELRKHNVVVGVGGGMYKLTTEAYLSLTKETPRTLANSESK